MNAVLREKVWRKNEKIYLKKASQKRSMNPEKRTEEQTGSEPNESRV